MTGTSWMRLPIAQLVTTRVDVQFCVTEKTEFIKYVHVAKIVKELEEVVSMNVNNCVVVFYTRITFYADVKVFIAAA